MDEPFGAVDPITRHGCRTSCSRCSDELRKTIVFVTHDFDEAIKLGDRIAILRRARRSRSTTPRNDPADPADDFVSDFVGAGSTLKQLTLARVSAIDLEERPTARVGERVAEVAARAERAGHDSVVVPRRPRPAPGPGGWPCCASCGAKTVPTFDHEQLASLDSRATLSDALGHHAHLSATVPPSSPGSATSTSA